VVLITQRPHLLVDGHGSQDHRAINVPFARVVSGQTRSCAVNENGRSGYIIAIIPAPYKRGVTTMGTAAEYSNDPLTATSPCGHEHHAMAGTMTKRPAPRVVRDEEAVRNHGETAASVEDCLDGLAAGRGHGSSEAADSLM
jgi:hypothetical protein